MATSEGGKACVIKFQANASHKRGAMGAAATQTDHLHFEKEAARWRTIWGAKNARAVILVGRSALVMPYVRTCEGTVDEQKANTKDLARVAIDQMLDRGHVHNDLRWEHVGLCRSGDNDKVMAVFIDLGDVGEFPKGDNGARQAAKDRMLKALGLQ